MLNEIQEIKNQALKDISECQDLDKLLEIEKNYLGKTGALADILKNIKNLDNEAKKSVGQNANLAKVEINTHLHKRKQHLENLELQARLEAEKIDVTLPSVQLKSADINILSKYQQRAEAIFQELGFAVADGPHIESELYNFDSLNFKKHHPARDIQDTFFIDKAADEEMGNLVLRTHTSPVQVRSMLKHGAPIKIIIPGRVYRNEDQDATHEHTFYQIEGLLIDENIGIGHLQGVLQEFLSRLFEKQVSTRFRPGYFPFTEPSLELDMSCVFCDGKGCKVCKHTGFIELLGCGMVHPNVLKASNIDPEQHQGFAFGMGLDRIIMLKYGFESVCDLRANNLRILKQL